MIYGNISHKKSYEFLPKIIRDCFKYVRDNDLLDRAKGSYPIKGDALFVNIVEYETTQRENRFWEAHKEYLDVHIILAGEERIDVNFIENMTQQAYEPKDDFLPLTGDLQASVDLCHTGDFLICYPEDGHRTAVMVNKPVKIKKAIFKVRVG